MKAVAYRHSRAIEADDSLLDVELDKPQAPSGHDLLVRVEAVSVNPVDTKVRRGMDPQGDTRVLGWDAAGIVEAVGPDAQGFSVGDAVYYAGVIDRPGSNAEYQLVDARIVAKRPASLSAAQAAALPLTSLTAWELLFDRLRVPFGKHRSPGTVLVTGAAGGVGSMALQLARQLTGLTVIGTASRDETRAWAKKMGAHALANHRQPLAPQLAELAPDGIHYALSLTHTGEHYADIVEAMAPQGHIGLIDDPEGGIDVSALKNKSLSLHWEFMYTRALYTTPDITAQQRILTAVAEYIDAGVLTCTQTEHFGLINAANLKRAHGLLESGKAIGKVVLEGFER
ncbi:zinc-binding alcohol dehydrogenase family protein [Oleiagrimonas sp. C23AA]|uniref:zinc-binding alcohol dehydrogenase family protein n=1 Tax=Oleiagrimonas sp. C23AA TaxID=2719047 RepID=UPI001421E27A|nr:zinc-binding alcohol dehydrogenase family protein [Oleiagrimonas sp. C23AA]NII09746.1 zinc-binding alcohol dehydrogenase family protein [Oleiagrimonas sp. C23AA]